MNRSTCAIAQKCLMSINWANYDPSPHDMKDLDYSKIKLKKIIGSSVLLMLLIALLLTFLDKKRSLL